MGYRTFIREQVALNRMPYVDKVSLRGYNAAISGSAETVWSPGATYAQLTTAVAMEIVSSSANDTAVGTGARTVLVSGLDANYKVVEQTLTLNGATPVALSTSLLAVNSAKVITAGSGLTNAGAIDVRVVSGAAVKCQIPAVEGFQGQSAGFVYTIPAGSVGLLGSVNINTSGATGVLSAYLLTKDSAGIILGQGGVEIGISNTAINPGSGILNLGDGLGIPEKTLVELRVIASAGVGIITALSQLLVFDAKNNGVI